MSRTAAILCVLSLTLGGAAAVVHAECPDSGAVVDVEITPSVINLRSEGRWVTVRAEIPFTCVEEETVTLEEIKEADMLSDLWGNLVVKFKLPEVKKILTAGEDEVYLELWGELVGGGEFSGWGGVFVIDEGAD